MLYDLWRRIAQSFPEQIALRDLAAERTWTFGQLQVEAEEMPCVAEAMAFPQGNSADFILSVLRAWRANQIVCPLDSGSTSLPSGVSWLAKQGSIPAGIAHLKTTSATTGAPRLIAFAAAQLLADSQNIVTTMRLKSEWPNLGVISLAHSYGFSNLVLPLLLHGIPLILVGSALPEAVRRAAEIEPAVTLAAVPALWSNWHQAGAIPPNVSLAISAGAPLPLKLEHAVFASRSLKIHNFYGSSECGGIAYDSGSEPRTDGSCAGTPLAGVEVYVSYNGCLEVRGKAVAHTYWPEASPSLGNGVFQTSDLAEISGGRVFLLGRAGDQINVAGRKVLPEPIEEILTAHPNVRECVVFGMTSPNADHGEMIVACLEVSEAVSAETMRQFAMTKLPAWQVPREWWFVTSIAANQRGKLSRAEWRRKYLERAGR